MSIEKTLLPSYILITSSKKKDIQRALRKIGNQTFDWAYIGENLKLGLLVSELMPSSSIKINFVEAFHNMTRGIKADYIDYVGDIGNQEDSLGWWLSWFSEKNPLFSKCFLYLSQTMTILQLFKTQIKQKKPLLLIIPERVIRKCILQNLSDDEKSKIEFFDSSRNTSWFNIVSQKLVNQLRILYFLGRGLSRIILSKYIFAPIVRINNNKYTTIIVTFITPANIRTNKKEFNDSYFPNLASIAGFEGHRSITLGVPLAGVSIIKLLRYLRTIFEPLTLPQHYLHLSDIFQAIHKQRKIKNHFPLFREINIETLINHDQYLQKNHHRNAEAFLFYKLPKRWKDSKVKIERIIIPYEGHIWARAFILGLRTYMPDTKIIGYQHSSIGETQLNYLVSQKEVSVVPIPDIIVANGPKAYQILCESGYTSSRIKQGGALRYSSALSTAKSQMNNLLDRPSNIILIASSIYPHEAAELLIKSIKAFPKNTDITLLYKPHPALTFKKILQHTNLTSLPSNLIKTEQSLLELLPQVTALIYTSSSSCAEGLATNTPLIHLVSEYGLDEDPLAFIPSSRIAVSNETQLKEAFDTIQLTSTQSLKPNGNINLIFQLLEDISYASYTVFLD